MGQRVALVTDRIGVIDVFPLPIMAAAAKRLFDLGVRVVGLGAMEWHMQMALEHIRKNSIG